MSMNHSEILTQLIDLEPIFHRWEHLGSRLPALADFERIVTSDFFEIGASGALYTRDYVLEVLQRRYGNSSHRDTPWSATGFHLHEPGRDTYLLTYTLVQHQPAGDRVTRRSTIWKNTDSVWQIAFHQGTIIQHP